MDAGMEECKPQDAQDARLEVLKSAARRLNEAVASEITAVEAAVNDLTANQKDQIQYLNAEQKRLSKENEAMKATNLALHQTAMEDVEAAKEELAQEKKAMADVMTFQHNRITLNVGGAMFTTSRTSLLSKPDSMLAAMFSGRHTMNPETDGSFFIDRDGSHFRHILNYLRNGVIVVALESNTSLELAVEAEYYGLHDLAKVLRFPKLNIDLYLGTDVRRMRTVETKLRQPLSMVKDGTNQTAVDLYKGLVSLFDDDGTLAQINQKHSKDPMKFVQLLSKYGKIDSKRKTMPVTVPDMVSFRRHFNINFAEASNSVLARLTPVLNTKKILIAGGAVLRALTSSSDGLQTRRGNLLGDVGDIDIFVCTQDPVEATQLCDSMFHLLTENRNEEEYKVVRGAGVINIDFTTSEHLADDYIDPHDVDNATANTFLTVQIVLRLYESPAEVLLGFDCDCCCLGFDGTAVWALPRAIRALQYGTNVLNPLHAWPNKASYEFRLVKYAIRGFSVSVPGLETINVDVAKIMNTPLSQLHGFARLIRLALAYDGYQYEGTTMFSPSTFHGYDIGNSHIKCQASGAEFPQYKDLAKTLKTALGEFEFARMAAANWHYDGEQFSIQVPEECCSKQAETKTLITGKWPAILQSPDPVGLKIPAKLEDAWDCAKRSREYLNAQEGDLDARYFAHAASECSGGTKRRQKKTSRK